MADFLDIDLPIAEVDPVTKEIKATPYFEDYLYKIIATLGGEGSTPVNDLDDTASSSIVMARIKAIQSRLNELDAYFDHHRLTGIVNQIQIDTMGFVGKVKLVNYTAINKDWIEARGRAKISLPANPLVNDQVIISNGDGTSITVLGNGNDIKYTTTDTSVIIDNQGTSLHFQLFKDQTTQYWRIR